MNTTSSERDLSLIKSLMRVTGLPEPAVLAHRALVSAGVLDSLKLFELYFEVEKIYGDGAAALTPLDFESLELLRARLSGGGEREA